jgi:zinc transport system ATP-binding protein
VSRETTSPISEPHSSVANAVQLSAQNVGVAFGTEVALKDVSFEVRKGEFIGLVGQNGSGKTTLLRVLLGLIKPSTGRTANHEAIIGYVPQRGQLYNGIVPISALEVAILGSKGDAAKAKAAIRSVGMADYENRNFSELSGGQQQRVVIAKALAGEADILMLDEPTTGVDKDSQVEFYALLNKLHQQGRTIIMVSHDIDSTLKFVSRLICLNRTVTYDGPPEQFDSEKQLRSKYKRHLHHEGPNV